MNQIHKRDCSIYDFSGFGISRLIRSLIVSFILLRATSMRWHRAQQMAAKSSRYVNSLFGTAGNPIMAGIITFSKSNHISGRKSSACGDYFSKFSTRFSYPFWIVFSPP